MMFWAKVKLATAAVVALFAAGGASILAQTALAEEKPARTEEKARPIHPIRLRIEKNGKQGYIDQTGKVVIEPKFEEAGRFSEGLAIVRWDGKWGYITSDGKGGIPPRFDSGFAFHDGLAVVQENGKFGAIDSKGTFVIEPIYDKWEANILLPWIDLINGVKNGLFIAIRTQGETATFVLGNRDGKIFMERDHYIHVTPGGEAGGKRFAVVTEVMRTGSTSRETRSLIDFDGKEILPSKYEAIRPFQHGLARIKKDEKWGCINANGEIVVPLEYDGLGDFCEGLALARKGEKWGYIDQNGKEAIPLRFAFAQPFCSGRAAVALKGGVRTTERNIEYWSVSDWVLIDRHGTIQNTIVSDKGTIRYINAFYNNIAIVGTGDETCGPKTSIFGCMNGKLSYSNGGETPAIGAIDPQGEWVTKPKETPFDSTIPWKPRYEDLFVYTVRKKPHETKSYLYGLLDEKGREIVPVQYDRVNILRAGAVAVQLTALDSEQSAWGVFNLKGKRILDFQYGQPLGRSGICDAAPGVLRVQHPSLSPRQRNKSFGYIATDGKWIWNQPKEKDLPRPLQPAPNAESGKQGIF